MNAKKSGLGRGLGALLDTSYTEKSGSNYGKEEQSDKGSVFELALNQIFPNPNQPRKEFDQEALEELSTSIKSLGIIQPLTVRKISDNHYELISGERRYRAAKLAGIQTLPVYIREADDNTVLELALVENIQRENLNPIEISITFKRLVEECEIPVEKISETVGKTRSTVSNYLRLLKLPYEVQLALRDNKISMGHARAIINLPNEEDQLLIVKDIIERQLSVRQVEDIVRKIQNPLAEKVKVKAVLPYKYQKYNNDIRQKFHTSVDIQRNKTGKGFIKVYFNDDDTLDSIIEHLVK